MTIGGLMEEVNGDISLLDEVIEGVYKGDHE